MSMRLTPPYAAKNCERCNEAEAKPGERYCAPCKRAVKAEMKQAGYLQRVPGRRHQLVDALGPRTSGGGSWDNAVRTLEDQ